jgi:hypothetical protein
LHPIERTLVNSGDTTPEPGDGIAMIGHLIRSARALHREKAAAYRGQREAPGGQTVQGCHGAGGYDVRRFHVKHCRPLSHFFGPRSDHRHAVIKAQRDDRLV